jgi:hypothetical protein
VLVYWVAMHAQYLAAFCVVLCVCCVGCVYACCHDTQKNRDIVPRVPHILVYPLYDSL